MLDTQINNMSTTSILDQIINNKKAEEVANLNAVEIINNLFGELVDRERDVLIKRHGLHGESKETLESIGNDHNLTRERIRQIETNSVKKLQQLKNLEEYVNGLKNVIRLLLEEHGGMMEKEYLLEILVGFSLNSFRSEEKSENIHKNYLNFLITKLLHNEFEEENNHKHFKSFYKLKFHEISHLEELVDEIFSKIKENKRIHTTEELIKAASGMETYSKHKEKFDFEHTLDISNILNFDFFEENKELINQNKIIYSVLKAAKRIEQNKFGHWGVDNWREIKPKTINDKIFLILKNHNKPLYFVDIAKHINEVKFDNKIANAATVHNELILDSKYVLVGRGLYGLKDWGYKKGNVIDVIEEVLEEAEKPLSREEIIERVLEKRMVKKATIILALMNKDKFDRAGGRYTLVNV
ncbi:hypothetical protein A2331_05005 [Candidatus Falkowbacteria bacterium RIFOXYB2_FULL_34_18]|uniref:HTH HARE-type domain-containing protein n=1 Tax=Candidatus Falkowbacteria bacterium RIFOXYD2_FULL_34_120 TaxID=1798007 RepID=A0A1F5TP68_9BACT|nr:MAG: hypothetical protein A2500_07245 [Candidatus Falkowbacteria bacterium RIFOXYC12_FULL_34_55]OGF28705.1 MAG: hypothetical protein A2331_05005 [Candidatus Falkowbacteria bacterium RIFOXYB2_FULL_34_18]OGF38070.1 MAG: hypothetical protein A2466_04185 [Candidatus Falkowbacteria bacterium RIFOXYC2_FULL_34_220]OGF38324.1 MAG: hypothetical protein A2515_06215 [Candidatus Falkowbacteria bacterium RIFOXYD12_FULL_34_57]OGF40311.1 MAG: hypothetical protein A2531_00475 [Candidatus Falkowbacteria bact